MQTNNNNFNNFNRYYNLFQQNKLNNEIAFIPFITLGDPNFELSFKILDTICQSGADALELGFPFSDPLADGPIIQAANNRALNANISVKQCFKLIEMIRSKYPKIAIGLLLYSNLILHRPDFFQQAKNVGVDSLLIADIPIELSSEMLELSTKFQLPLVFIAPPNADSKVLESISKAENLLEVKQRAYTYLLSRSGVTGIDKTAEQPAEFIISELNKFDAPPCVLGFGISKPEHITTAKNSGIKGVISGSAVVKIIQDNLDNESKMLSELSKFIKLMKAATKL